VFALPMPMPIMVPVTESLSDSFSFLGSWRSVLRRANVPLPTSCALVLLGTIAGSSAASASGAVAYELFYDLDRPDVVRVRVNLPNPVRGERVFVMPRSVPMGYGEVPYDRFVHRVLATSTTGRPIQVNRGVGSRWRVGDTHTVVSSIEYLVNVKDMEQQLLSSADSSKIRVDYVGLLGYSVFGYVDGLEERPVTLTIRVPAGWPVFCTLAPQSPPASDVIRTRAANFYAFADSQIVAGSAATIRKIASKEPLFLALYAETDVDIVLLCKLIEEAMGQVIAYFDSAPFEHYTVHFEFVKPISAKHVYGFSMEHMDSCTVFFDVGGVIGASSTALEILRTRYNLAHHFAHSWIPKRACGEGYFPFTWEHTPILDTIWLSEGFVQYAAVEMITDGLSEKERVRIRQRLIDARFRRTLLETPEAIKKLSLVELSRAASTKYSEDFRYGRNVFSRGAMMAMELDELIREKSGRKKRFRDAMRYLTIWCRRERRPFKIAELPGLFKDATDVDVASVLGRWLATPAE
jgi:predicted metalloprotease with PDZ domain